MAKSSLVAAAEAALPSLYADGPTNGSADVEMPKVYVQADLSQLVKDRVTRPGDVILALSNDDVDPTWLIGEDPNTGEVRESYRAYILASKRFVIRDVGGGTPWEYLDDNYQRQPDERDVWVGYNYLVAIPEANPLLPARQMFVKTAGTPVYKKINTYLEIAKINGSQDPVCVEFSVTKKRGRSSGQEYYALVPKQVAPDPEELPLVMKQYEAFAPGFRGEQYTVESNGPAAVIPEV